MMDKEVSFEDVWLDNEPRDKTLKRWGTIVASFFLHFTVVFFVLYGSMLNSNTKFPELKVVDVYVSIVPKPPSTMRGAKKKTQKKTKLVKKDKIIEKKTEIVRSALIVPVEIPGEIVDEDEEFLVSDIEFGSGGGVEGGIEGGYEGGVLGGSILGDVVEEVIDPVRVNGGDIKLIKKVVPEYPPQALKMRVRGNVIIELTTGAFGRVKTCRVIHGHPLLDKVALDAVKQWRYKPYLVRGKPTPIIATIIVEFDKANY